MRKKSRDMQISPDHGLHHLDPIFSDMTMLCKSRDIQIPPDHDLHHLDPYIFPPGNVRARGVSQQIPPDENMKYSTVQHCAVPYRTVQYSTVVPTRDRVPGGISSEDFPS